LSGFAFLLPRLLAGASGAIQQQIGYAGFFWMSGAMSLASVVFLPIVVKAKARPDDAPVAPS
jgi:PAT family beta-lactamase induction signal transducer AmpG